MVTETNWNGVRKLITLSASQIKTDAIKKKIEAQLNSKLKLEIGFFETAKYTSGVQVAQVAFWNEYGTVTAPPRPFFRNAIEENKKEWLDLFKRTQIKTKDIAKSLNIVGTVAKDDVSDSIVNLSSPPNNNKTIGAKGSSNPLIDTGVMKNSVTYKISKKD